MANSITASVTGIDALNKQFGRLATDLGKRALPPSLQAGVNVLADEVRARAQAHSITGEMAAAVETGMELSSDGQSGEAAVGFGNQDAVAMHVEFGHREITEAGADVGQVPAHPIIRPAFDSSQERATDAFGEVFAQQVNEIVKG